VPPVPSDETFTIQIDNKPDRQKRYKERLNQCREVNHIDSFKEIGINYVILPTRFNSRCVGT